MTEQITDKDIQAVNRLREYYRRQAQDWTTNESFLQWLGEVLKAERAKESARVQKLIKVQAEKRPYDNQVNKLCKKCGAWKLHARGRKYYTCLTCNLKTTKDGTP